MSRLFKYAHSGAPQWGEAAQDCLSQIGEVPADANLGFVYATDHFANRAAELLAFLKKHTAIEAWVGSVGLGVCATGQEYLDRPGLAVMLARLPAQSFRVFQGVESPDDIAGRLALPGGGAAHFAAVHGDPRNAELAELIAGLAGETQSGFLVGGLTSSRFQNHQFAGEVTHGGVSGVAFGEDVGVVTRLTQGVSPLGPRHLVTEGAGNIIARLDGRPALDVLREDVGEIIARDLQRAAGYVFVGLPVTGSDTGDYLVRPLVGLDLERKLIAIGDAVQTGDSLMFCRRDGNSALEDMHRMLNELQGALAEPPRGGLYFSCLGRGEGLFGPDSAELRLIRDRLGDFPLVGFFANGEISHDRLYGYTGVLTLFT